MIEVRLFVNDGEGGEGRMEFAAPTWAAARWWMVEEGETKLAEGYVVAWLLRGEGRLETGRRAARS